MSSLHHSIIKTGDVSVQLTAPAVGVEAPHTRDLLITEPNRYQGDLLHVIVPINNYVRYKRRYELYWKFKQELEKLPNVVLYTVEVAFGGRSFMVTDSRNPRHLQLRTDCEIWHKENSINLMVQRLPADWKYVAWIDGDIEFLNKDVATETIHQLQHYKIVQMFQTVTNLGPGGEVISTFKSFCSQYLTGKPYIHKGYDFWHPGFAWAATRQGWNDIGGLPDFAILGAGDHHMALALIGKAKYSLPGGVSETYRTMVMNFEKHAERNIKRNIGSVNGNIVHYWHGKYSKRKYIERWDILTKGQFDPLLDIIRDWQGLYYLDNPDKVELRDGIRAYFRQRNEDSIDNDE